MTTGFSLIESLTKKYSESYGLLSETVQQMNDEIDQIKKRFIPVIKKSAEKVRSDNAALKTAIEQNAGLFTKPKSLIFYGIKVGLQKQKGVFHFDDAVTIKLVKKHFPDQVDIAIKTEEKLIKKWLDTLSGSDLKKIAVHTEEAGDAVLIKSTDSDIEKFVNQLIGEEKEVV